MILRMPLLAAALAAFILLSSPVSAQAPAEPNPLDPPAPAAAAEPLPDWLNYKDHYAENKSDLSQARHSLEDVLGWAEGTATDALSLPHLGLNAKLGKLKAHFTQNGWSSFGQLLRQDNLASTVQTQEVDLNTIANGEASMGAHGVSGGRYQWTVTLPVMISYSRAKGNGETQQSPTQQRLLQVIAVRGPLTADSLHNSGLLIDSIRLLAAPATGAK